MIATEDSNLEERIGSGKNVSGAPKRKLVARFSPGMYAYLRKNGLISEDEKHWAGHTSNYQEVNQENVPINYDHIPIEYDEDTKDT